MDVDLLLKIAGIGILTSVISQILSKSGRDEQAMLTNLTGLIIVLMLVVSEIGTLFDMVKNVFNL